MFDHGVGVSTASSYARIDGWLSSTAHSSCAVEHSVQVKCASVQLLPETGGPISVSAAVHILQSEDA